MKIIGGGGRGRRGGGRCEGIGRNFEGGHVVFNERENDCNNQGSVATLVENIAFDFGLGMFPCKHALIDRLNRRP